MTSPISPTIRRPQPKLTGETWEPAFPGWAQSPKMRQIVLSLTRLVLSNSPILLSGAPGSGKNWMARQIHQWSQRTQWQRLRASEIQAESLNNFLRPTTPHTTRTLVIREAESLREPEQEKLAEWLDQKEMFPEQNLEQTTSQLILLSRDSLPKMVGDGFLECLGWRLMPGFFQLPDLEEREEDLEGLISILLSEFEQKYDLGPFALSDDFLQELRRTDWRQNIRQLKSVLEKAVLTSNQELLGPESLSLKWNETESASSLSFSIGCSLADAEKRLILETLKSVDGHRQRASRILGISRRKLQYRLQKYREEGHKV